jgi:hypothetical protein
MAANALRTQSQDPADMFEGKNVIPIRFKKPSPRLAKLSIIAAPVLFIFQKRVFQNRKHKLSLRLNTARMQQSLAIGLRYCPLTGKLWDRNAVRGSS